MSQNANIEPRFNNFERLHEMIDAMKDSIANTKKIAGEQRELMELLDKTAPDKFEGLRESLSESTNNVEVQTAKLETRIYKLEQALCHCEDETTLAERHREVVDLLLDGLGVFNK